MSIGGYIPAEIKEKGYALLAEAVNKIPVTIKVHSEVAVGSPAESILEACRDGKYDMVVMGSRGLGSFRQLVMGSISQYVLHHAPCPVTVVR